MARNQQSNKPQPKEEEPVKEVETSEAPASQPNKVPEPAKGHRDGTKVIDN